MVLFFWGVKSFSIHVARFALSRASVSFIFHRCVDLSKIVAEVPSDHISAVIVFQFEDDRCVYEIWIVLPALEDKYLVPVWIQCLFLYRRFFM